MLNLKCYTVGQFLFKFERVAWVTTHPFALYGHFPFIPKFQKFLLEIKWSRPFSVRSNRNIWDHPHRWSTLTGLVHLTKVLSPVLLFSILLTRTITKHAMVWVSLVRSGLCNWNLQFQWAHGISEISNWNFCWVESALCFRTFVFKTIHNMSCIINRETCL